MSQSHDDSKCVRPFICPCGKAYLSYPALFTHIKQKHDGNPPGPIIRPRSVNKRGRPRKVVAQQSANSNNSQMPDFKTYASRFLFNKDEEEEIKTILNQVQLAKQKFQTVLDQYERPSISSNNKKNVRSDVNDAVEISKQDQSGLRQKLKQMFEPHLYQAMNVLTTQQLDVLIKDNKSYQQVKLRERSGTRSVIGFKKWEMNLMEGILQFLDWAQDSVSKRQYKNMQILMSLLVYYFIEEVVDGDRISTVEYVTHLNNFAYHFLGDLQQNKKYQNIFILEGSRYLKMLTFFHQWLFNQRVTHYSIQENINWHKI